MLALTFTQNFTSITYGVIAVAQNDSDGYGPAYLVNGLSNKGYWYQAGLAYNWNIDYPGFYFIYEVWDANGNTVYDGPTPFPGAVNPNDTVRLKLYFSGGNVVMFGEDLNTSTSTFKTYSDNGAMTFIGLPTRRCDSNGYYSGLLTEWYHGTPYYANEAQVIYSDYGSALSSAWMWMMEFNQMDGTILFNVTSSAQYSSNPTELQPFSFNGTTEYSSAYTFLTGALVAGSVSTLTITACAGGTAYPAPGQHYYMTGTQANVTANPYGGNYFDNWTLDGTPNYSNPITVTMTADHSLTAYFSLLNTLLNTIVPQCALKTTTDGYFYVPNPTYVTATLLRVEMLFDNSNSTGDQTGGNSPYPAIADYPNVIVDMRDISLVAKAVLTSEGQPNWNYMADLTGLNGVPDRKVDMRDIALVASNFGKNASYAYASAGVHLITNSGGVIEPTTYGFAHIPIGATSFHVTQNGNPIGAMIIFFASMADIYGDQIQITLFTQNISGTWITDNAVGSNTYVPGMTIQINANQQTVIEVGVFLNITFASDLNQAYSYAIVNITIGGVVTNYPMIGYVPSGRVLSYYYQLTYYWPSVSGSTAWTPPANFISTITIQYQAYYSGSWNTIETWKFLIGTGA